MVVSVGSGEAERDVTDIVAPPQVDETTAEPHVLGARLRRWAHRPAVRQAALALVPVAVVVVMAWDRRWMADDGFLHLRVVDQVLHGNGPVFNAGERVETSTSPLWVAVLTVLSVVPGVALAWKAVLAGLALTVVGMIAAGRAAVLLGRASGATGLVWPAGLAALAALPPIWDFATSGLETGLAFGWIGTSCWWVAARVAREAPPSRRAELAGAALLSLGYTIRPDLALFTAAFGAVLLAACRRLGRRRVVAVGAALVAIPLANQIFRMGYYAMLVPTTAVAKEASVAQWGSGWRYLVDLVVPYALWLPAGAVAVILGNQVVADRARGARLVAAARLAPVFGLLAPVGIATRWRGAPHVELIRPVRVAVVATATWTVLAALLLRPGTGAGTFTTGDVIEDERRTWQILTGMEHPVRVDYHVRYAAPAAGTDPEDGRVLGLAPNEDLDVVEVPLRPDVSATAAGVFMAPAYAWGTDVYVIDMGGLAHPIGGHLDQLIGDRMGHQKAMGLAWQLAELTTVRVVVSDGDLLVSRRDLAAARRATTCGQLGTYLEGIRDPLTPGRFARNLLDSFANTALRIPPDPRDAEAELCGD
jgi:arabinofuranosyltransferase